MNLHEGVALDWGSSGAADDIASALTTHPAKRSLSSTAMGYRSGGGGGGSDGNNNRRSSFYSGDDGNDAVNVGVTGEVAMAQALVACRAEQAVLEERGLAREHCLARVRGEALRLRAVLERWHGDFVVPAVEARRGSRPAPAEVEARKGGVVADAKHLLERKLLGATADLLGARDEAAGMRGEVASLRALVARLREDEVCVFVECLYDIIFQETVLL